MGNTNTTRTSYFYRDKPIFGLDIGHSSIKVMQISADSTSRKTQPKLRGWGTASFDGSIIVDGELSKPEVIAAALKELFNKQLSGDVTTRRVALTIPTYRTFTRSINLPKLKSTELTQAIETEAERYIPLPLSDLNLDYEIVNTTEDSMDILVVAIPKKIVKSYMTLCRLVNIEPVLIETTMHAAGQILRQDTNSEVPTMIIDFGSLSSDVSLYHHGKILLMGTVPGGGENFTHTIEKALGVSYEAAGIIKNKYGLGLSKKQAEIIKALTPTLAPIIKEITRMLRYYEERFKGGKPIGQIIVLGGGANMPGLSDYLTNSLRLPTRTLDPWQYFDHSGFKLPTSDDKTMFATVAGLALTNPRKVFSHD